MKHHKLNIRFFICFFILFITIILGIRVIYMLLQGQVSDHGEEMSPILNYILLIVCILPLSTYLYSTIIMLKQYIYYKAKAYQLTEQGIENTLTYLYLFAFVFVLPVKLIPWEAVKAMDSSDSFCHIYVNVKMIKASFLAKAIIFFKGYKFLYKFSNPPVMQEELYKLNYYNTKKNYE